MEFALQTPCTDKWFLESLQLICVDQEKQSMSTLDNCDDKWQCEVIIMIIVQCENKEHIKRLRIYIYAYNRTGGRYTWSDTHAALLCFVAFITVKIFILRILYAGWRSILCLLLLNAYFWKSRAFGSLFLITLLQLKIVRY